MHGACIGYLFIFFFIGMGFSWIGSVFSLPLPFPGYPRCNRFPFLVFLLVFSFSMVVSWEKFPRSLKQLGFPLDCGLILDIYGSL